MIEIKSYIGSINIQSGKKFTLVHEYDGKIKDCRHIDGSIELTVDGLVLISQDQWDLVDQLWIYIINGIEYAMNRKDYTTCFPDSPINLSFKQATPPDTIEMIVGQKSVVYNTQELVTALLFGAEKCLKEISRIIADPNFYKEELQKIHRIRVDLLQD
jgi:uncharacterized protein YlzI (FlbEa/FlbD family)